MHTRFYQTIVIITEDVCDVCFGKIHAGSHKCINCCRAVPVFLWYRSRGRMVWSGSSLLQCDDTGKRRFRFGMLDNEVKQNNSQLISFLYVCMVNTIYLLSFVETPRKFIIAELSIRKLGSSSVLIIRLFEFTRPFLYIKCRDCMLA